MTRGAATLAWCRPFISATGKLWKETPQEWGRCSVTYTLPLTTPLNQTGRLCLQAEIRELPQQVFLMGRTSKLQGGGEPRKETALNLFYQNKEERALITDKMVPNIEQRASAWLKIQEELGKKRPSEPRPTVTISREYGSEAYPLAEMLKKLLEQKTGDLWTVFDKALIERVSHDTGLSTWLLSNLGGAGVSKPLDEIMGTLMPRWKTHTEAYRLL